MNHNLQHRGRRRKSEKQRRKHKLKPIIPLYNADSTANTAHSQIKPPLSIDHTIERSKSVNPMRTAKSRLRTRLIHLHCRHRYIHPILSPFACRSFSSTFCALFLSLSVSFSLGTPSILFRLFLFNVHASFSAQFSQQELLLLQTKFL